MATIPIVFTIHNDYDTCHMENDFLLKKKKINLSRVNI